MFIIINSINVTFVSGWMKSFYIIFNSLYRNITFNEAGFCHFYFTLRIE